MVAISDRTSSRTAPTTRRGLPWLSIALFAVSWTLPPSTNDVPRNAAFFLLSMAVSLVWIVRRLPGAPVSVGSIYAAFFALFHGGLALPFAFGWEIPEIGGITPDWVHSPSVGPALLLASQALLAFTIAYGLAVRPSRRVDDAPSIAPNVSNLATLLLVLGVASWFWFTYTAGALSLSTAYQDFLARTSTQPLPHSYLLIGIGLALVGADYHDHRRHATLLVFVAFAAPAFAIGLRGEVLIPFACYLIGRYRGRPLRRPLGWALLVLAGLSLGAMVKTARASGPSALLSLDLRSVNPMDGLAEMGYTLRPLVTVLDHASTYQPGLATYLAPLNRLLVGTILGQPVTATSDDPDVFRTFVVQVAGPIGGSPAAEALRSFGTTGVVVVMALIGLAVAWLDSRSTTPFQNAAVAAMAFPLLLWVRNDITPVLFQVIVVALVLAVLRVNVRRQAGRASRRRTGLRAAQR